MANTLLSPTIIAKEALMQLKNNMVMGGVVHREYKKEYDAKIGSTLTIRKPVKFRAKDGATLDEVDIYEGSTSITVSSQKHVAWAFSSQELSLNIEEYSERYIKPAMIALANQVDADGMALYKNIHNCVGTPGSTPDSFADVALAAMRLDDEAVPSDGRVLVMNPAAAWSIAGAMTSLYNPQMVKDSVRRGAIGHFAGFDTYMDQNVPNHTTGKFDGTLMVGANASSADETLYITGFSSASVTVLKEGDVFAVSGVNAVNPVSGSSTGVPRQFVVTADVTSSAGGSAEAGISPILYDSTQSETMLPYQTVDTLPVAAATITPVGSENTAYPQNLAFHKNAFALVTVPLALPDGAAFKARESAHGLSLRVIKDYDITNDKDIIRIDILYGWKCIYPELACRLVG